MKRAFLALLSIFLALPAFGQVSATNGDRFVRVLGGTPAQGCFGNVNADCGTLTGGICSNAPNCAFQKPDTCTNGSPTACGGPCFVSAGDTCYVQPGSYVTGVINPSGNGTSGNPLTVICDQSVTTGECLLTGGSGGDIVDIRGQDFTIFTGGGTLEGMFVIEGGKFRGWGPSGSDSNQVSWIRLTDRDFLGPFAQFETSGGNLNTISDSILFTPQYGTSFTGAQATPFALGLNAATAETNTTADNLYILGGRNSMSMNSVTSFLMTDSVIAGAQNHSTNWCNGGVGCVSPTFESTAFLLDATFLEANPQILGTISNPTFLNDLFIPGTELPFDSHGCKITGTLVLRNSLVFSYDSTVSDSPMVWWTAGSTDLATSCTSSALTHTVDYNGYSPYFSTLSGSDNHNIATNQFEIAFDDDTPPTNGTQLTGNQFNAYKADPKILSRSMDQNSRLLLNLDLDDAQLVKSTGATATKMYGTTGPLWGAHVEGNYSSPTLNLDLYPPTGTNDSAAFTANSQSFCIVNDWGGTATNPNVHVDDFFIFGSDVRSGGKVRQITALATDNNCGNQTKAGLKVTFTPALDWNGDGFFQSAATGAPFAADKPQYNVGTTNGGSDFALFYGFPDLDSNGVSDFTAGQAFSLDMLSYTPVAGSALIDAGDPALCAETAVDGDGDLTARCDIGPGEFTGTAPPNNNITIAIADGSATEGTGAGTTNLVLRVTQNQLSTNDTTFLISTQGSSAIEGTDYTGQTAQTKTIVAGQLFVDIPIVINRDALYENAEFFNATISGAANAEPGKTISITDTTATGTIGNDDAVPTLSISNQTVTEGVTATFTGTLSAAAGTVIQVDYNTIDGTAKSTTPDPDFTAVSGTWTFTAGQTVKTVDVSTVNDSIVESPPATEQATLNLVGSIVGVVSNSPLLIITDNDTLASITNLTIRGGHGRGVHFNGASSAVSTLLSTGLITANVAEAAGVSATCTRDATASTNYLTITGCSTSSTKHVCIYNYPSTSGSTLKVVTTTQGGRSTVLYSEANAANVTAMTTQRAAGVRFAQLHWLVGEGGLLPDPSATDGATSPRLQSCHLATVLKYIYDNFTDVPNIPLCAIGNSNGADAIGHTLADYGGSTWLDAVYLGSGPISTALYLGCSQESLTDGELAPVNSLLGYPGGFGKTGIDEEHGYAAGGGGPCDTAFGGSPSAATIAWWNQNSLAYSTTGGSACTDHGTFYYPNTWVTLATGEDDSPVAGGCVLLDSNCGNAPNHADIYHDEITNNVRSGDTTCHATQTLVEQLVAAGGTNHAINETNPDGITGSAGWSTFVTNRCTFRH